MVPDLLTDNRDETAPARKENPNGEAQWLVRCRCDRKSIVEVRTVLELYPFRVRVAF